MKHRKRAWLVILLSLLFIVSVASPARAVSTAWDPNDVGGTMDLRWVGLYREDSQTVRVSITLWDPVRDWMFRCFWVCGQRTLYLHSRGMLETETAGGVLIYPEHGDWLASLIDGSGGGNGVLQSYRIDHPNPYTFRVWMVDNYFTGVTVQSCSHQLDSPGCFPGSGFHDSIPLHGELDPP